MIRRCLAAASLLVVVLAPPRSWGQSPPTPEAEPSAADVATARELFRDAAAFAQEGKWIEALDRYERSMALRPSPLTRYSIAVAQSHVGKLIEASENIRTFFHDATPDLQPYVQPAEDLLRAIEPRIARLTIRIPGEPRGAAVKLDGRDLPSAAIGVDRVVNPGEHRIEATVPGHVPFFSRVELAEGSAKTVVVTLTQDSSSGAREASRLGGRTTSASPTTGMVLVGVGGSLFIAGGIVGAVGLSKAKDSPTKDGDEASKAKTFALVGDVAMASGLVAAGLGAYLWATSSTPASSKSVAVAPWTTGSASGLSIAGGF